MGQNYFWKTVSGFELYQSCWDSKRLGEHCADSEHLDVSQLLWQEDFLTKTLRELWDKNWVLVYYI